MRHLFTTTIAFLFLAATLAPATGQSLSLSTARALKSQNRNKVVKEVSKPSGTQAPKRSMNPGRTQSGAPVKSSLPSQARSVAPKGSNRGISQVRPSVKGPQPTQSKQQKPAFPNKSAGLPKVSGKPHGPSKVPNIRQPNINPSLPTPEPRSKTPNLGGKTLGPKTRLPEISGKITLPGPKRLNPNGVTLPGNNQPSPNPNLGPKLAKVQKFDELFKKVSKADLPKISPDVLKKDLPKLNLINPIQPIPEAKMQRAHMMMSNHFHGHAHCDWWVNVLCGWYSNHYGCHWTNVCLTPGYWDCWTPCHYRIVYCHSPRTHVRMAWYLGLECMLIPDLHALGVQEVSPMSPAYFAGLEPGDMILSVNGFGFDSETTLTDIIRDSDGFITLEVFREGLDAPITMDIQLRRMMVVRY
jgi:hypothetical protein